MNRMMHEAMRLMQTGDLGAATRAIQRGLQDGAAPAMDARDPGVPAPDERIIEGAYRVVPATLDDRPPTWAPCGPTELDDRPPTSAPCAPTELDEQPASPTPFAPAGPDQSRTRGGEFRDHHFDCDAGAMRYKLFFPDGLADPAPPLIVMLHGCTQSPDDFARGTRMNALAQEHGYVVAYPAQTPGKNPGKCWNWFRSGDQQRGQGEPATLAALARHLVQTHGLDERRVYVAGLSAGGAMATVLASTYPDVFAAIGVHSGLPFGAAHDLPSAFAAMKQGGARPGVLASSGRVDAVPAIVFHGDRDATVDPCNGADVIAQFVGSIAQEPDQPRDTHASVERGAVPGGRSYSRTIYTNAAGTVVAEQWLVHGGGHAWFGGDAAGSYTDPSGPDASEHMLRFFSACARAAIN